MTAPETDVPPERHQRTRWLIIAGAASLLLPLLGLVYIQWNAASSAPPLSGRNDLFEHREGSDKKIVPSQTAVPSSALMTPSSTVGRKTRGKTPSASMSSLDYIKPNIELTEKINDSAKSSAPAVKPTATENKPAHKPRAAKEAPKKPVKKAKKDFAMPKLQPSRGFTNMGNKAGKKASDADVDPETQDLLNNLPTEAQNNPDVQRYINNNK
jgi:hypothetical protein